MKASGLFEKHQILSLSSHAKKTNSEQVTMVFTGACTLMAGEKPSLRKGQVKANQRICDETFISLNLSMKITVTIVCTDL